MLSEKKDSVKRADRGRKGKDTRSKSPLISIVTVSYNAEREIGATASSVASQSFRDFEYLIVDGASTDSTIAIARLNGPKRLRILSEHDDGLYDAMNKGLAMARGEYVIFLNAGDAFHSEKTLESYARAIRESKPDIIYGDTIIVDSERKFLRPRHLSAPERLTAHSFSRGMLICHQAFMVRRSLASKYDLTYRFSADYDWCLKCIHASRPGKRINLKTVTIDYLDNGLTEKNKRASLAERFLIMKSHFGLMRTLFAHMSFIPRALSRKIRHAVSRDGNI